MRTVIFAILCLFFTSSHLYALHQGFCKPYQIPADSNEILLTVPENCQFVIRKLYAFKGTGGNCINSPYSYNWKLTINDTDLLTGLISYVGSSYGDVNVLYRYQFIHDFPDNCVVIPPNSVLRAHNFKDEMDRKLLITLIGYFTDIDPSSDFNQDGIVNFEDFAIFAESWLR